jgi:hypothetical protein
MPARSRNSAAAEHTISALRGGGRIEDADAATVALVRHLAGALDLVDPGEWPAQVASLARAQLAALKMLRGVGDDSDDSLGDLVAALSGPMGDAPES